LTHDYNTKRHAKYIKSNISYSSVNIVEEEAHNEICRKMIKEESSLNNQNYEIMKDVQSAIQA